MVTTTDRQGVSCGPVHLPCSDIYGHVLTTSLLSTGRGLHAAVALRHRERTPHSSGTEAQGEDSTQQWH